ncbi:MAG: iron ABC transporter permease [Bifidobacterium sp.]|uniref:Iron ABC transporter permease n=1 Tax=Bifidobacterium fermentum TaxID=3059035 RepID=A0AB39UIG1_9BIFI
MALCLVSVAIGSRTVPFDEVFHAFSDPSDSSVSAAAVRLRVPRTVLGILAGISLAVAGTLMQGMTRNPLADPSILGLNSGAAFAIVLSMAFFGLDAPQQYVWVALIGSSIAALAVWLLGSMGPSGATVLKLTLAGAVITAMLSSLTSAVLLPRIQVISTYRFWQVGGLSGARFALMTPVLPLIVGGLVLALVTIPGINALAMGDELAEGLGSRVKLTRGIAWIAAVLLSAGTTSLTGPIGFVGLVVPHAARLIVGSDYRHILAISVILGPMLLLASDIVGRILTRPSDIEVGIVTAIIGAPFFIILARGRMLRQV